MKKVAIRNRYLLLVDIALCFLIYAGMILIAYDTALFGEIYSNGFPLIIMTTLVNLILLSVSGIYRMNWAYAGTREYAILIGACFFAGVVDSILGFTLLVADIGGKVNVAVSGFIFAFLCAVRFFVKFFNNLSIAATKERTTKALVIGAGSLAVMVLRDISLNQNLKYNVVGLIDDDESKHGMMICGSKVMGGRKDILSVCLKEKVEEIIFAICNIHLPEQRDILDLCSKTGCKVKIVPGVSAVLDGTINVQQMRDVEIEDLLKRDPIVLDNKLIEGDIFEKTILVTGGGGSIGSELCRQIIKYNPKKLVILDIYENTTYELQTELDEKFGAKNIEVVIASVRDKKRLDEIFDLYKPDVVFHAAAHKHVPLMEFSATEAIKNNVFGTYNVAECAARHGATRFVMISTDKAVNPTNVMGATKRMCEMIIEAFENESKTGFVAVRFGNVLGSHGSVVPKFKKQIEDGGPVTVTHPEITRFFMTIPEAAQLVLQAASYAKGGEIFVLDMGEPVKIYDLAKKIIRLSGFVPDEDIKIEFTGLREGEKLYEELLMAAEGLEATTHKKIFVEPPMEMSKKELEEKLAVLSEVIDKSNDEIKEALQKVVPTYHPADN